MNFEKDLAEGQEFERLALRLLGTGWSRNPDRYGPDLLHPTLGPCECKFDRRAHVTGKVFFETSYRGQDSGVFKYPGLKRWMQGSRAGALLLRMDDLFFLVNFRGKRIRGGDRGDSEGVLLPWQSLKEFCEKSFDTAALPGTIVPACGQPISSFSPMDDVFQEAQDIFGTSVPVVQRKRIEPGAYIARLYAIADLGTQSKTSTKGEEYQERTIKFSFELPTELSDFGKGKLEPASVHDQFVRFELKPNSKTQRPTLFKYAQALVGLTAETLSTFRVDSLLGKACSLTIESDGEYDNIAAVAPLTKGVSAPEQMNPSFKYSILSDGFESDAFKALNKGTRRSITKSAEFAAWEKDNRAQANAIKADCAKQA